MRKITIIGTGYVGLVSGSCFSEIGNEVLCCDIDQSKIDALQKGIVPIYEPDLNDLVQRNVTEGRLSFSTNIPEAIKSSEIIYIAVGTPMLDTGEADLRYVREVAKTIGIHLNEYKVIVNKSTVPVGTGKLVTSIIKEYQEDPSIEFDVVSNPEFLREGSAIKDCMMMERAVIGTDSDRAAKLIEELHAPFKTHILRTNLESAEMIKYAANAFLATKISFINDIANICEKVGADVTKVAEGMGFDSRIGHEFLKAGIGYGGSCFPKDTQALIHIAEKVGYELSLVKSVVETNNKQRRRIVDKAKEIIGSLEHKNIAVLGLSFKPNTDDMREAPSLSIIPELVSHGAKVKAFDPIAIKEAKKYFGESISYSTNLVHVLKDSDICLILTDWPQITEMDLYQTYRLLKNPIIVDGRNCFDLEMMSEFGFIYYSVGRRPINNALVPLEK